MVQQHGELLEREPPHVLHVLWEVTGSAGSGTPLWWPNTLPVACLAMGLGGQEPWVGAGQESSSCTARLDHNFSASQGRQTSAAHRHDPTQRRTCWRTSDKPLFHSKIPFRHLLFLILIAGFHLGTFLTAHAVSSA